MLYVGEGERGSNGAFSTLPDFHHSLCYPQSNWARLVLIPEWVSLCSFQESQELSCESGSFSPCCLNPSPEVFNQKFEAIISLCWNSGLHSVSPGPPAAASLASCSFARPAPQSASSLGPLAATLL